MAVGDDHLGCVDVDGPAAGAGDGRGQQQRRQPFPTGDDEVAGARREVFEDGDGRQDLLELADRRVDGGQGAAPRRARRQHGGRHPPVALAAGS